MPSGPLVSRARGCMLGLACGNLLGLPNEFRREPPALPVTDIDPAELDKPWDDDLAQAVELAQALLRPGGFDAVDFGARLDRWARENGRGMGAQTRRVLELHARGIAPLAAARHVWESSDREAAGNGGVMRVAPVGLRHHDEPAELVRVAVLATAVTHCDPRCTHSAATVAAAVAALLDGRSARQAALDALDGLPGSDPEFRHVVEILPRLALDDLPIRTGGIGYTLTCAAVGLWAAEQEGPLEETLLAVTNAAGDADTNGAVAGALLGARFGVEALPERWLARVRGRAELERLGDALLARA
jgi:ADP-ribosyl-[dinitrogen reductase] hydrolase